MKTPFKEKLTGTEFIFIIISLIVIAISALYKKQIAEQIKNDYKVSVGYIVKYRPGVNVQSNIDYCYVADDSVSYYRTIDVDYKFKICQDFEKCKDKRYWVIYSSSNPKNSLINLNIEIQGIENPEFPKNLNDFK